MENRSNRTKRNLKNTFLVLLPGILILLIQYVWKMAYLWKGFPGFYWLFVFLDQVFLPSITTSAAIGVIFLVLWRLSKSQKYKQCFLSVSLSLFIMSASIISTFPMILANNTLHMQSIRANGRTYYMGAYPLFDINFYVVECEPLGILCRTIYRSGDIMDSLWANSRLTYDESKRMLELHEPEKGIIFSYQVSK